MCWQWQVPWRSSSRIKLVIRNPCRDPRILLRHLRQIPLLSREALDRQIRHHRNQFHLNPHDEVSVPTHIILADGMMVTDRASPSHGRGMLMILICLILISVWIPTIANGAGSNREKSEASKPYEVAGTLSALDLVSGRGIIRTDLGKPIYLEVRKPDLVRSLSVGDRVTIQVNEDGQVDKIMGESVPELVITGQPILETTNK